MSCHVYLQHKDVINSRLLWHRAHMSNGTKWAGLQHVSSRRGFWDCFSRFWEGRVGSQLLFFLKEKCIKLMLGPMLLFSFVFQLKMMLGIITHKGSPLCTQRNASIIILLKCSGKAPHKYECPHEKDGLIKA